MRNIKRILVLLMCILMLPAVSVAESQIDINRNVSFTVSYTDGETALTGAQFDVYKVASIDANAAMTVTEEFKPFSVELQGLDQEGWQQLAMRLKGEAQLNLKPLASAKTDKNGNARFTLKPGLYLVIGNALNWDEDTTYVCDPFMAFLPGQEADSKEWNYDVTANPKHTHPITIRKILKDWKPEEPDNINEISVDILCDGVYWDTAVLTKENEWRFEWEDEIDPEHKHDWSYSEIGVENYLPDYDIKGTTLLITNTYIPPVPPPPVNELPVVKKISGSPSEKAKFSFTLKAQKADNPMPKGSQSGVKEISITGAGTNKFGAIEFKKPGTYVYTVSEKNDGVEGYTYDTAVYTICYTVTETDGETDMQISIKNGDGKTVKEMVFTNKYSSGSDSGGSDEKLPQTGLLWWPVPALLAAGLLLLLMGVIRRRGN